MRYSSPSLLLKQTAVGYFAPLLTFQRMWKKHSWNYAHHLRVLYRFTERK